MKRWTHVRTYSIRTIFSEPKFLGCIDYQIFLPVVLRCARLARESSAIILFYFQAGAKRWLKDTNCKLRMFVDPERHLYSALGLRRSLTEAWSISKLVFYAEQKRAGRRMFEEDDPNQIGGDFILDEQGRLALIHRSKIWTDRPPVEELLSCVKDLNRAKANL